MINFLLSFDDYILQLMFSFLNMRDRIKCEKVSSAFKKTLNSSFAWKRIDAELTQPYNDHEKAWIIDKLCRYNGVVQELILDDMHDQLRMNDFEIIFREKNSMPNLLTLSVSSFNLNP